MKHSVTVDIAPTWENAAELLLELADLISTPRPATDHADCVARYDKLEQAMKADHERFSNQYKAALDRSTALLNEKADLEKRLVALAAELEKKTPPPSVPAPVDPNTFAAKPAGMPRSMRGHIGAVPHVGEVVRIAPNGNHHSWTSGVVKAVHNVARKGKKVTIDVLPTNHGQIETLERKYIKRIAANVMAELNARG